MGLEIRYLPNITRVIISMKTVWEGHVAHIGKTRNSSMVLSGKLYVVWCKVTQFGPVQLGAWYLSIKFKGKIWSCIRVNMIYPRYFLTHPHRKDHSPNSKCVLQDITFLRHVIVGIQYIRTEGTKEPKENCKLQAYIHFSDVNMAFHCIQRTEKLCYNIHA